jgi:hypothetical protein
VTGAAAPATADMDRMPAHDAGKQRRGGRRGRRRAAAVGGVLAVLAAVAAAAALTFGSPARPGNVVDNGAPTALRPVTRGPLSEETQVTATLGYAGSYLLVNHMQGTYTSVPASGQAYRQGQVLYQVDQTPVILLYGTVPLYRALSEGMTGSDVQQLNRDLVALGEASSSELDPGSDYFSSETADALEKLQSSLRVTETGSLQTDQAIFVPGAVQVISVLAAVGGQAGPGSPVAQATSTARQVTIALDATEQSEVKVGNKVTITLPDGQETTGTVSSVGTVVTPAAAGGTSTVTVLVTPASSASLGDLTQAPVEVSITTATVPDALAVPVDALLPTASGGYEVEVVSRTGRHYLVPVSLGVSDQETGQVQVSGPGLAAGQEVVVPSI